MFTFLDALSGILFEPRSTIPKLLEQDDPPFKGILLFGLLLTIFVPAGGFYWKYGPEHHMFAPLISLLVVIVGVFVAFLFLQTIFFQIIGFQFTLRQLIGVLSFSLTPLMLVLWLMYLFNYLTSGKLTVVGYVLTGAGTFDDRFLAVVPFAFTIALLNMLLIFFYSVRFLGSTHSVTAVFITMLSLIPLTLSLIFALILGEQIREGTIVIFDRLFTSLNWSIFRSLWTRWW